VDANILLTHIDKNHPTIGSIKYDNVDCVFTIFGDKKYIMKPNGRIQIEVIKKE
jgi:hypothetical protein